jgi:magnesium-transporting ATPase (P-type)
LNNEEREQVKHWSRDQVECDAKFLGLILFHNQLKPGIVQTIAQLHQGDTRIIMITGDNASTGIHVARSCGMIPVGAQVLLSDPSKSLDKKSRVGLNGC